MHRLAQAQLQGKRGAEMSIPPNTERPNLLALVTAAIRAMLGAWALSLGLAALARVPMAFTGRRGNGVVGPSAALIARIRVCVSLRKLAGHDVRASCPAQPACDPMPTASPSSPPPSSDRARLVIDDDGGAP